MTTVIHDVVIIGAGPAGLAVAARLREPTPSALFTDAERNRYQWIKKHSGRMYLRPQGNDARKSKCSSTCEISGTGSSPEAIASRGSGINIKVLDSSGRDWLSSWKSNFAALSISHLRSPMFFHPGPRDRDGLLAFAQETGRCNDCVEIANCVGKSMSKHRRKRKINKGLSVGSSCKAILEIDERDRKDYFTPSADIFNDYCQDVVDRYSLTSMVEQGQAASIDFGFADDLDLHGVAYPSTKLFKVVTNNGTVTFAKIVVLAVGAGGSPAMPRPLSVLEKEGACHSTQLPKQSFLARHVTQKMDARMPTTVVVVGGGLTAAQIADKCVELGVKRVYMIIRSALIGKLLIKSLSSPGPYADLTSVKPFDIDLDWMAKYKNVQKAAFWSADSDEERLEIMFKARNGGSITPRFHKKLRTHVASGALSIHTQTTIKNQIWHADRNVWTVDTEPPIPEIPQEIDYIYYATGVPPNIENLACLSPLRTKLPTGVVGGMPCLTDDLAWAENVPLFISGRLAGLRIGPDCGNLEGARAGAERISWAVETILERQRPKGDSNSEDDAHYRLYQRVGSVNMYEALEETDDVS